MGTDAPPPAGDGPPAGAAPSATRTSMPPAVAWRGLHKRFGTTVAVDDVTLDIPRGSFFGVVGPNGAGKTTTMRMATGLLRPDGGHAEVGGLAVWPDPVPVKARIGVLPEDLNLFERLTGEELVTYHGLLRRMPEAVVAARTAELLSVLGLADAATTMVVDYSHGMRKKVALAAALLHAPPVLFLDEPFEALDPVSARTIRAVLDAHVAKGGTIVFSSHVMALVESLCDRVAIVHAGHVVAAGRLDDVRRGRTLEEAFLDSVGATGTSFGGLGWLGSSSA
ncbi:MAG: ABC transporter ATP-binding protein [Acidimicrobiales bacterium]